MIVSCPKCNARHDVSARKPGETFSCSCGNVIATPKKGGLSWFIILAIVAGCSIPCIGILEAIAIPNFINYQHRAKASEARINLMAIKTVQMMHFAENEAFMPAGPVPATVPGRMGAEFTPDDGFAQIGWKPEGKVRYQYEVRVTGPRSAVAYARGDLDEDGQRSEYKLEIGPEGAIGQIQETDPLE
ncbi:MAG: hypothetical protein HY901_10330 [Deltaproteobacteria bacterium]|nr:hypothetical protein [Deltaproteobacteria bacterium]